MTITDLRDSWALTTAHLTRAAEMATDQELRFFRDYLGHNEFELAADVLAELGNEHGQYPRAFWEALGYAYEGMSLPHKAALCRLRIYEAEHGYVEARLTLFATSEGGCGVRKVWRELSGKFGGFPTLLHEREPSKDVRDC